jgi:hypothetical protein
VFSIPQNLVSRDAFMRIEYDFAWEEGDYKVASISTHSVKYLFELLPNSALSLKPPNLQIDPSKNGRREISSRQTLMVLLHNTMTSKDEGKMRGLRADTKPDVACFDD